MIKITKSWQRILNDEFDKQYFKDLQIFLNNEYQTHTVYPKPEHIFNSINYVTYENVKVVIIGQDPYHGENQAMGMSFSVPNGQILPPSLKNIFKEIESDLSISCYNNGDLTRWEKQGVLLLNAVLTVRAGCPNSHKNKGWEQFTTQIIKKLNERTSPIIFVLWGNNAKYFEQFITNNHHYILKSAHPSPLSAYNGFFGSKHFSKINNILKNNNLEQIDWR